MHKPLLLIFLLFLSRWAYATPRWWQLPGYHSGTLAGRFDFRKIKPPPGSSLLFFVSPTPEPNRMERLYVLNPRSDKTPQMILKSDRPIQVEARLDERTILFSTHAPYDLYLLDLVTARWRPLLKQPNLRLFKATPEGVYFFGVRKRGDLGFRISGTTQGRVDSEPEPEQILYYVSALDGVPRRVFDRPIGHVVLEGDKVFLMTTARPDRQLWWVAKDRRSHRCLLSLPEDWLADLITGSLSPDGSRLALGVCHPDGFFDRRDLVVLDSGAGTIQKQIKDIPLRVSVVSSFSPNLNTFWLDNQHLRWSESEVTEEIDPRFSRQMLPEGFFGWRDLDLSSGQVTPLERYEAFGLRHSVPSHVKERPDPTRRARGLVDVVDYRVFARGSQKPIDYLNEYRLSPEGDFGILNFGWEKASPKGLWLWDARFRRRVKIFPDWTYDEGWNETRLF